MLYNIEEKLHAVNTADDYFLKPEIIPSNVTSVRLSSMHVHCHVPPDDKSDHVIARNRLILVLIFCLIFMTIEIIGM